jgi:histidine ammonia-lyase
MAYSLGSRPLSLEQCAALSQPGQKVQLSQEARRVVKGSRAVVERTLEAGESVYGVNTGFGRLAGVSISPDKLERLQRNLILSHATGVGEPLPVETCRLAFALRIHNLAMGYSGVRPELLDFMVQLYNDDIIPKVPSQGSVGASGDLAPLAHMALPLLGRGAVWVGGRPVTASTALKRKRRQPLKLAAKEGLALINGTQIMTAIGLLVLHRARNLSLAVDIACAMTVEALRASAQPFHKSVHDLRVHKGQGATARNLRALLKESEVMKSHAHCEKVQDAYSLRCAPQVHGASKDAIAFATEVLLAEANAVTDNPLVFPNGRVISAGNFHGQPVSQALDFLKIGLSTLANISERRIENLVNPDISGLPPFLAHDPGIESGLMIPQVVAAALASENKTFAHPASVDTIPTSANREDHVSMGVTAARHAEQVLVNTERVVAIELMCGAQGLDCGEPLRPGRGVAAAHRCIRESVPRLQKDRFLAPDLRKVEALLISGQLVRRVEKSAGALTAC